MKKFLIIITALIFSVISYGQINYTKYYELQAGISSSRYFEKLIGHDPQNQNWFGKNTIGVNVGARYFLRKYLAFSAQINPTLMSIRSTNKRGWTYGHI